MGEDHAIRRHLRCLCAPGRSAGGGSWWKGGERRSGREEERGEKKEGKETIENCVFLNKEFFSFRMG